MKKFFQNDKYAKSDHALTINVRDVNDNPPILQQPYEGSISENTPPTLVMIATAIDKDASPEFKQVSYLEQISHLLLIYLVIKLFNLVNIDKLVYFIHSYNFHLVTKQVIRLRQLLKFEPTAKFELRRNWIESSQKYTDYLLKSLIMVRLYLFVNL